MVLGKLDNELYKLFQSLIAPNPDFPPNHSALSNISISNSSVHANVIDEWSPVNTISAIDNMNKAEVVWHYRLSHIPFSKLKTISALNCKFPLKQSFNCPVCPLARQTRPSFPDSSIQSTHPFQLIHIDTWGPYHTPTYNDSKYFLTIIDDFSRATWTHLMGAKSNAFDLLKAFIAMVETQFHTKVQAVRSDNALELGSTTSGSIFFSEKGIQHQISCPHTPQQNGVVERKHNHLLEIARALLFQSHLPIRFWGDCLLTATYLINRFPSPLLNHKSPYELLYGSVPSYSHLKAFDCLCYSTVTKLHKDKFSPRSIPCVFVGYNFTKKGHKLYSLTSKTCFHYNKYDI